MNKMSETVNLGCVFAGLNLVGLGWIGLDVLNEIGIYTRFVRM